MQFKKGTTKFSNTRKLAYYNVDENSKLYLRLSGVSPPRHQNDHQNYREPQQPRQQAKNKKKSSDDEDDDDDDDDGFAVGGVQYDAPLPKRSIVAVEEEMLPRKGTMEADESGGRSDSRGRRVIKDRDRRSRDRDRDDWTSRDGCTDRVDSRRGGSGRDRERLDTREWRVSIDRVEDTRSDRSRNRRSRDRDRDYWASRDGNTDRVDSRGWRGKE